MAENFKIGQDSKWDEIVYVFWTEMRYTEHSDHNGIDNLACLIHVKTHIFTLTYIECWNCNNIITLVMKLRSAWGLTWDPGPNWPEFKKK